MMPIVGPICRPEDARPLPVESRYRPDEERFLSIEQSLQSYCLEARAAKEVVDIAKAYSTPKCGLAYIQWLCYRTWNAIKAIFGQSDWQKAENILYQGMSDALASYLSSFDLSTNEYFRRRSTQALRDDVILPELVLHTENDPIGRRFSQRCNDGLTRLSQFVFQSIFASIEASATSCFGQGINFILIDGLNDMVREGAQRERAWQTQIERGPVAQDTHMPA